MIDTPDITSYLSGEYAGEESARDWLSGALEGAYKRKFTGCPVDVPDAPQWARKVASKEQVEVAKCENLGVYESIIPRLRENDGDGKRACYWNHAMAMVPESFVGFQNYGNCTAASQNWAGFNLLAGVQIALKRVDARFVIPYGTALTYSCRTVRAGMALSTAARAVLQKGTQLRTKYCGGKYDFTDENTDETLGHQWGLRGGPPKDLVDETKEHPAISVARVDNPSNGMVKDVMFNGGFIHTGSTLTAQKTGDPVSKLQRIGGHAQSIIGYDDTDEFREWYGEKTGKRLDDYVVIFDQTWGNWNRVSNWPEHLWGRKPEGAFVLRGEDAMALVRSDAYTYTAITGFDPVDVPVLEWSLI